MERSLFIVAPWVGLQMTVMTLLALAGLLAVTVRLAREPATPRSDAASAGPGADRPSEPLTPEWLERLITGVGHPPAPRPKQIERDAGQRDVA